MTGLLIGWRIRNGFVDGVLAFLLLLLFGFALIWLGIWVGSLMRTVEAVQGFMFTVMFPLTFVANTFAPTESMPPWLRTIAEWNPVSAVTQACRELWGNGPPAGPDAAWPLQHPVAGVGRAGRSCSPRSSRRWRCRRSAAAPATELRRGSDPLDRRGLRLDRRGTCGASPGRSRAARSAPSGRRS